MADSLVVLMVVWKVEMMEYVLVALTVDLLEFVLVGMTEYAMVVLMVA
jgi:hypothetical protein